MVHSKYWVIRYKKIFLILICIFFSNCNPKPSPTSIEVIVEEYVRLVLQVSQYDSAVVDAYFGPDELEPSKQKVTVFSQETLLYSANDLFD